MLYYFALKHFFFLSFFQCWSPTWPEQKVVNHSVLLTLLQINDIVNSFKLNIHCKKNET